MGRSVKGLTNYMTLSTKSLNNKQSARVAITDITNQYFRKLIKEFNNSPYIGYKKKQVHNEPTEAYFFLVKHVFNIIQINKHVLLRTKIVKLYASRKNVSTKQLDVSMKKFSLELL